MVLLWWMWLLFGFGLLLVEIITPGGFYVFFFGVGAILVGLLSAIGVAGPAWLQWLLFGSISLAALLVFRKPLLSKVRNPIGHSVDSLIGETAVALQEIASGQIGKAEMRGTAWNARNVGATSIYTGQRCLVEQVEGLTLYIRG